MQFLVEKYTFYLVFNNMDHGKNFKQMRLCADFNAGPSKEISHYSSCSY